MARSREDYLKAKREGMARLRTRDPEAAKRKRNEFHAKNREQQCARMRAYQRRRFFWWRARRLEVTPRQLATLWKRQRGRCALTGRRLDRTAQLDHILPRAKGGCDRIENLRWLCPDVNLAKRDMTDEQFTSICQDVLKQIAVVESMLAT
jgi:5-methylcytosine-specific restriction endonuclease McrA